MVSKLVRDNLERRAGRFNLILDDVSITHVTFSPAFSEAVEAKQIAQQTAQRAAYLVDQALQEKQSIIVKAQGEARSAELIGEAVKQNKGSVLSLSLSHGTLFLCRDKNRSLTVAAPPARSRTVSSNSERWKPLARSPDWSATLATSSCSTRTLSSSTVRSGPPSSFFF